MCDTGPSGPTIKPPFPQIRVLPTNLLTVSCIQIIFSSGPIITLSTRRCGDGDVSILALFFCNCSIRIPRQEVSTRDTRTWIQQHLLDGCVLFVSFVPVYKANVILGGVGTNYIGSSSLRVTLTGELERKHLCGTC